MQREKNLTVYFNSVFFIFKKKQNTLDCFSQRRKMVPQNTENTNKKNIYIVDSRAFHAAFSSIFCKTYLGIKI